MSEADDKALEEYLRRKSALSLGYKRLYVEDPPPELDRAITARARRALKYLVPGALALAIALTLVVGVNIGVNKWVKVMVGAEQTLKRQREEQRKREAEERAKQPVSVMIDARNLHEQPAADAPLSREEWLAKIDALKRAGKTAEAQAEQAKFQAAYPAAR